MRKIESLLAHTKKKQVILKDIEQVKLQAYNEGQLNDNLIKFLHVLVSYLYSKI